MSSLWSELECGENRPWTGVAPNAASHPLYHVWRFWLGRGGALEARDVVDIAVTLGVRREEPLATGDVMRVTIERLRDSPWSETCVRVDWGADLLTGLTRTLTPEAWISVWNAWLAHGGRITPKHHAQKRKLVLDHGLLAPFPKVNASLRLLLHPDTPAFDAWAAGTPEVDGRVVKRVAQFLGLASARGELQPHRWRSWLLTQRRLARADHGKLVVLRT